ncbi:MAG: AAA family ATPase [Cyanobacteriota bacterium]|nr:AAA family ATPase [Cyanobacteriota bacterium]
MTAHQRHESPPWLEPLSAALTEALPRLYGQAPEPRLAELMDALLRALARGELELDLAGPAPEGIRAEGWPQAHRRALAASPLGRPPHGPLVLEGDRLRWRRWQAVRQRVLERLTARARRHTPSTDWEAPTTSLDPLQGQAIRAALERDLLVLAGGPGTGKTSTVAHLLSAVCQRDPQTRVHLAAPTGKATARLRAATGGRWPCSTLHQLLESRGEGTFRRHQGRPLELDLLVVDEVSMVDLALMDALLNALPEPSRLVLVGDPAQLAPVAPGSPLRELLRDEWRPSLRGALVTLATTYRNAGAIAMVAAALRELLEAWAGSPENALEQLRPRLSQLGSDANLRWSAAVPGPLPAMVAEGLRSHRLRLEEASRSCGPERDDGWQELRTLRDQLLVLTPKHRGTWGVEAVHRELLGDATALGWSQWPSGTPVLCTRNLHGLGLSNGDLGVLVVERGERWLVFGHDRPIWLHPAQLSGALQPALALTVHKAQGSEAERVMVLLPEPDGVDPRLLYTALTRARREAWLLTAEAPPSRAGNPPVRSSSKGAAPKWEST